MWCPQRDFAAGGGREGTGPAAPSPPVLRRLPGSQPGLVEPHPQCSAAGVRIVVVGAGYAGLTAALRLGRRLRRCLPECGPSEIVLVDRQPHHVLKTRLHESAARGVEVTIPFGRLLRGRGIRFLRDEVTGLDLVDRRVHTRSGWTLRYHVLVLAVGSVPAYFGIPGLEAHALRLNTPSDAQRLREHVERNVAVALGSTHAESRRRLRRVVVIGGGLTGVELATELAERLEHLTGRHIGVPEAAEVMVVEPAPRLLPAAEPALTARTAAHLRARGIVLLLHTRVRQLRHGAVVLETGETIEAGTIVWTGGVEVPALLRQAGAAVGPNGRLEVDDTLQLRDYPGVYAVGDAALAHHPRTGAPLPMSAQFALQQGRLVAENIAARLQRRPARSYRPRVLGEVVSLGRHLAVASLALGWLGRVRLLGFTAGLLKRAIAEKHLLLLRKERLLWQLDPERSLPRALDRVSSWLQAHVTG